MTSTNFLGRYALGGLLLAACLLGCNRTGSPDAATTEEATDTPTSGRVAISVDETFSPVMESQVDTFQKLYVDAHVKTIYEAEDNAFLDLLNDKVKIAIATRELNADEQKEMTKQEMYPKATKIGIDGLAIILHPSNPDSLLTVAQLRDIFSGKTTQWSQVSSHKKLGAVNVVFDANRSSTSRFVRDTLLRGAALTPKAFAAQSNPKLLDYVAAHPDAIGVVGVNWISDTDDPSARHYRNRVRVASITARPNPTKDDYIQPDQVYLVHYTAEQLRDNPTLQTYPLRRNIYAVSREARAGLGTGFVSFVAGQKGQLIIQKSGLMPANIQARIVSVRKTP